MDKKTNMAEIEKMPAAIEKMPMEEKLALLGETDKAYIRGYVERAVLERKRAQKKKAAKGGLK